MVWQFAFEQDNAFLESSLRLPCACAVCPCVWQGVLSGMSWQCLLFPVRSCCGEADTESEDPQDPHTRQQHTTFRAEASDVHAHAAETPSGNPFELLDVPLLELIIDKIPMEELLVSSRGVCQEWRCISETTAVRKFQKKWCLDDVSGRPRNFGSLVNLKPDAFVTRWSYGSVESISALAVAANVPTAQLKRTNNLMSEHSLHSRDHLFVPVGNATGLHGEFYFCPVIGRQFVVFQPDSGGNESGRGPALDSATEQAAKEASFVKLAVLLSRGLRVDLGTATFYLQNAKGDIRQAVSLHQRDVSWDRARRR